MCYRLVREKQVKEENIKENLVIKCESHSKDVACLTVQAFLPELWLLDDSSSTTPSPAHLPHAITEQTCTAFLLFLSTTPFLYSYFLEEDVKPVCSGKKWGWQNQRLSRSISWVTGDKTLDQILMYVSESDALFYRKGAAVPVPSFSAGQGTLCCLNRAWGKGGRWKMYLYGTQPH